MAVYPKRLVNSAATAILWNVAIGGSAENLGNIWKPSEKAWYPHDVSHPVSLWYYVITNVVHSMECMRDCRCHVSLPHCIPKSDPYLYPSLCVFLGLNRIMTAWLLFTIPRNPNLDMCLLTLVARKGCASSGVVEIESRSTLNSEAQDQT